MKKFLSICFGLLLCLALTACGNSAGDNMKYDIIVHLEVNPSFDIYADKDGIIESVECLNEDAQTVYKEMDLKGVEYTLGFEQLLTAIHEVGFFKEEAKLIVEIKQKSSVTFDVSKVTNEVIADFDANVVAVDSDVSNEVVKEEQAGGILGFVSSLTDQLNPTWEVIFCVREDNGMAGFDDFGEILLNITLELDENKQIIKVEKEGLYANKGPGVEANVLDEIDVTGMYLMDGVCMLLDNMSSMKTDAIMAIGSYVNKEPSPNSLSMEIYEAIEQYQSANGLLIEYFGNNWKSKFTGKEIRISDPGDGFRKEIHTVENGKLVFVELFYSDGKYGEQHFDENRNVVFWEETSPNGDRMEERTEYNENGERVYSCFESTGTSNTMQESFFENGKFKKTIVKYENGDIVTFIYDENEMYSEIITEHADGNKWITKYSGDDIVSNIHYEADGTVTEYDVDGNVISESNP